MPPLPPSAQPRDDLSIPDEAVIWRRISKDHYESDTRRPSTAAFSDPSDGSSMSATAPPSTLKADDYAQRWGAYAVAEFTAGELRALGFGLTWVATDPPDLDPYHVEIHGPKTGSRKKKLKSLCRWAYEPKSE